MTESRRKAGHLTLKKATAPKKSSPRGSSYVPPEHWYTATLATVLGGMRPFIGPSTPSGGRAREKLSDPEMELYYSGDLQLLRRPCVAIVGTRDVSAAGAARARRLARELVAADVTVVSGLAKGVDTEALSAAIEAGGRVVAVIGTPLEQAYPAENKRLQELIYRDHLLISQFPTGARTFQGNFPLRNRTMAALSDATVIIEAGETSGTLHQAVACNQLGRWLFITRAVAEDPNLTWPNSFLAQPRSRVLSTTMDVLAVLQEHAS